FGRTRRGPALAGGGRAHAHADPRPRGDPVRPPRLPRRLGARAVARLRRAPVHDPAPFRLEAGPLPGGVVALGRRDPRARGRGGGGPERPCDDRGEGGRRAVRLLPREAQLGDTDGARRTRRGAREGRLAPGAELGAVHRPVDSRPEARRHEARPRAPVDHRGGHPAPPHPFDRALQEAVRQGPVRSAHPRAHQAASPVGDPRVGGGRPMTQLRSYKGLRALVTGASSGIGRALALRLAREGARVALVARRADELERLAAEIRVGGGETMVLPCDVAEAKQGADTAMRTREGGGGIDLLVNNAGYGHHRTFLEWSLEDIERMMRVNYLGSVYFTKALLPSMVEQRRGWVVFVASVAGKIAPPEESAYAATKFAMVGLAGSLSIEVEDAGVHVLTACPGLIRT